MQYLLKLMEYLSPSGYFFNQCFFIPLGHLLFIYLIICLKKSLVLYVFMDPDIYS